MDSVTMESKIEKLFSIVSKLQIEVDILKHKLSKYQNDEVYDDINYNSDSDNESSYDSDEPNNLEISNQTISSSQQYIMITNPMVAEDTNDSSSEEDSYESDENVDKLDIDHNELSRAVIQGRVTLIGSPTSKTSINNKLNICDNFSHFKL